MKMACSSRNTKSKFRDFRKAFDGSDIIFCVNGTEIHANKSVLCLASKAFKKMIDAAKQKKISNEEIIRVDLDEYDYAKGVCVDDLLDLMKILHPPGSTQAVLKDRKSITRLLPVLRVFYLHDLIQICEQELLKLPRHPQDFIISADYNFQDLRSEGMIWASQKGYNELTNDPDWGLVGERHRLEIFENMLKVQDQSTAKLEKQQSILESKKDMYKDFVIDIDDIINGRGKAKAELSETMCIGPTENIGPHGKGRQRDCEQCRWHMVSMIHNLFERYRNRRPSDSAD